MSLYSYCAILGIMGNCKTKKWECLVLKLRGPLTCHRGVSSSCHGEEGTDPMSYRVAVGLKNKEPIMTENEAARGSGFRGAICMWSLALGSRRYWHDTELSPWPPVSGKRMVCTCGTWKHMVDGNSCGAESGSEPILLGQIFQWWNQWGAGTDFSRILWDLHLRRIVRTREATSIMPCLSYTKLSLKPGEWTLRV